MCSVGVERVFNKENKLYIYTSSLPILIIYIMIRSFLRLQKRCFGVNLNYVVNFFNVEKIGKRYVLSQFQIVVV